MIYANGQKGKPIQLLQIPGAQMGSAEACARTVRCRSRLVETVTQSVSTPLSRTKEDTDNHLTKQQASLISISRSTDQFLNAAKEAGLKIVTKFTRVKEVAQVKAHMSMETIRMLKRANSVTSWDTTYLVQKKLSRSIYEIWNSNTNVEHLKQARTLKQRLFARVTNVADVIKQTVTDLSESKQLTTYQNIAPNVLSLLLTGDKGSTSTHS